MIAFERSQTLWALTLLFPAGLYLAFRIKRIAYSLGLMNINENGVNSIRTIKRKLAAKFLLRMGAWISFTLAISGFSWGTKLTPVQKSGDAIYFVFDISYSMLAEDVTKNEKTLTRLQASQAYAQALLQKLTSTTVGIVLAKGDGVVAVPLTEDRASLLSLIESLSPQLMSSAGSSIGKGIQAAIHAFPASSAQAAHIWVFTDGDETDESIESALEDAARYGIPVTLLGFGSEAGANIVAGDGKTIVHTVLQEQKLIAAVTEANKKLLSQQKKKNRYENALAKGSAYSLLQDLQETLTAGKDDEKQNNVYAYEIQPIERYKMFIFIALMLFVLSFVAGEFSLKNLAKKASALIVVAAVFSGCTIKTSAKLGIAEANWEWYQKNFYLATAGYLQVYTVACENQDAEAAAHATFGLAATYLMQEEYAAAQAKLEHVDTNAASCTPQLKSATFYNQGIIAHQKGDYDSASSFFKAAILADNNNTNAKINLEITERQRAASHAKETETEMQQASETTEDSALKTGIFNLIKENEQDQWKKLQASPKDSAVVDY